MSFDDTDIFSPTFTVTASCLTADGLSFTSASGSASPWDMNEMENCGGGSIATEC